MTRMEATVACNAVASIMRYDAREAVCCSGLALNVQPYNIAVEVATLSTPAYHRYCRSFGISTKIDANPMVSARPDEQKDRPSTHPSDGVIQLGLDGEGGEPVLFSYCTCVHSDWKSPQIHSQMQEHRMWGSGPEHGLASDRKSTRLNSSHSGESRMPSSA